MGERLRPFSERISAKGGEVSEEEVSVKALELEKEAWEDLAEALERSGEAVRS